ncbi:MAG: GNAT family N-acetyltransferase, partial [Gammaproteobacteria bacterium]
MSQATFAPFQSRDEGALDQLLKAAELCTDDLTTEAMENFLIAHAGDVVVGAAGLEQYDDVALLRSVVVEPSLRGTGLGKRLVDAMEEKAQQAGV